MKYPDFKQLYLASGFGPDDLTFTEEADYERGFGEYFSQHVRPVLVAENERRLACNRETRRRLRLCLIIGIVAAVAYALYWSLFSFAPNQLGWIPGGLFVMWIAVVLPRQEYRLRAKRSVLEAVAGFFPSFRYELWETVPSAYLTEARLVPPGEPRLAECFDHLHGDYEGTPVESWQLRTATSSGDRSRTLFAGLFIRFGLRKPLTGVTVVKYRQGLTGSPLLDASFKGLEHVSLEDPDFEKRFDAYSTSQTEARYLLTPDVMQNLKELSDLFGGAPVQASFLDRQTYLTIELKKKFFEPPRPDQAPVVARDLHTFLSQMNHVFRLIRLLNLERR